MFSVVGGEGRFVSGVCAEGDGVRKWDVGCGGGGCGTTGRAGVGVVGWMSGVSLGQRGANDGLRGRLGVQGVGGLVETGGLRWCGRVEGVAEGVWCRGAD